MKEILYEKCFQDSRNNVHHRCRIICHGLSAGRTSRRDFYRYLVKQDKDLKKGDPITAPTDQLTYVPPAAPNTGGLHQAPSSAGKNFVGWNTDAKATTAMDLPTLSVSGNQTFYAIWSGDDAYTTIKLDDVTGANAVAKTFAYLESLTPTAVESFTLILTDEVTVSSALSLTKNNINLTIASNSAAQRKIKSGVTAATSAFLTLGPATGSVTNLKLTLENILLEGVAGYQDNATTFLPEVIPTGTAVGNSLVRVQNGAELILGSSTKNVSTAIRGHRNSGTGSEGSVGNGSTVCVVAATLTMLQGSVIEANESTTANGNNRNLVGGVYTIKPTGATTALKLNISGGEISNNKCTAGNTQDVYATEGGDFILSGNVKIDEITLNADPATNTVYTTITVSNLGDLADVKLSLRTTTAANANAVQTLWLNQTVLKASSTNTLTAANVGKFKLKTYKWNGGVADIPNTVKIADSGTDIGKFVQ